MHSSKAGIPAEITPEATRQATALCVVGGNIQNEDVPDVHPSSDELEAYALGTSSDADLDKVEEHLLFCERCQNELALADIYVAAMKNAIAVFTTMKRLRSIHITDEGPIFGAVRPAPGGKWVARHWGRDLDGSRTCDSLEEAKAYLMDSFQQMFPEHVCSDQCVVEPV